MTTVPPIPDHEPSEGATLLDELHAALTRYVAFPSPEAADAVTLWDAATHAQPAWEHAPRLAAVSPEKRCGKSRLLDVIEATCHDPMVTVNASTAAVVRSISADPPTLLVDEADTIFGSKKTAENNEDLRGLLNAGHQRNRPFVRWDITTRKLEQLPTFAMAMLAGIGDLPDTIMDRAIVVRMRRRAPGEKVAPYRTRRDAPPLNALRDRLTAWIRKHLAELEKAEPEMPLEDRAADTWEPLIAIADLAGGHWPQRARTAAVKLTADAGQDTDRSLGLRLLADLREVFGDADALYSATILERLHKLDESPWQDLFGKPLDARGLSTRLRAYEIRPKNVREGGTGEPRKGYARADLHDAWQRYVPLHPLQPSHDDEFAGQACSGPVADDENESATAASSSDLAAPCSGPVADDETAIRYRADQRKHPDVTAVADVAAANVEGEAAWQPPTDADAPPLDDDPASTRPSADPAERMGDGSGRIYSNADDWRRAGRPGLLRDPEAPLDGAASAGAEADDWAVFEG